MGLTKQYLRYVAESSFGAIASAKGGLVCVPGSKRNVVAASCAENVNLWNLKSGEREVVLRGQKAEVTSMAFEEKSGTMAVGYNDGSIKLFNRSSDEAVVTLNGHKSAVTCLAFDSEGHKLVSGARDTAVIVWDVVNECGLYRLKGHKGPITNVAFMKSREVVVSSSKDSFVKFWDLSVQHCFKTLTGHVGEVWDFALIKEDQYLVTGTNDSELRVWSLVFKGSQEDLMAAVSTKNVEPSMKKLKVNDGEEESGDDEEEEFDAGILKIERLGSVLRAGQDKVAHVVADDSQRLLVCHGSDNTVELFVVCSEEEVKKRLQKKAKKKRKGGGDETVEVEATIKEELRRSKVIKAAGKVRQVHVQVDKQHGLVTVSTANNLIEQFTIDLEDKNSDAEVAKKFDLPGHRSDVRAVSFSSDNTAIMSASHESVKVWNRATQTCIRTMPSGYGLCGCFVPGDRHVVIGTKKGTLQIFDLASAALTEEVAAHEKEIWSMDLFPDRRGFVTASGDKTVKFWQFELVNRKTDESDGTSMTEKQLSVIHLRTLKLDEDALAVKLSQDGRLIAVSLLDSTVKVFFVDSLKFFLSLYGHKLPALALDISTDSTLLVTGSADKNVKIWGLDFGDCHKSIFAHDDNITSLQFIPNTHMFFSVGKDGKLKQWDADNFQRIQTLEGHHGEVSRSNLHLEAVIMSMLFSFRFGI